MNNINITEYAINNLKFKNFTFIEEFHYYQNFSEDYDEISNIEINFIYNDLEKLLEVSLRFIDIDNAGLRYLNKNFLQITGFRIIINDSKSGNKYSIEDYENGVLYFECKEIEILKIEPYDKYKKIKIANNDKED